MRVDAFLAFVSSFDGSGAGSSTCAGASRGVTLILLLAGAASVALGLAAVLDAASFGCSSDFGLRLVLLRGGLRFSCCRSLGDFRNSELLWCCESTASSVFFAAARARVTRFTGLVFAILIVVVSNRKRR